MRVKVTLAQIAGRPPLLWVPAFAGMTKFPEISDSGNKTRISFVCTCETARNDQLAAVCYRRTMR